VGRYGIDSSVSGQLLAEEERNLVNTVMNLRVLQNVANFLSG
jgi:hypothetical protein